MRLFEFFKQRLINLLDVTIYFWKVKYSIHSFALVWQYTLLRFRIIVTNWTFSDLILEFSSLLETIIKFVWFTVLMPSLRLARVMTSLGKIKRFEFNTTMHQWNPVGAHNIKLWIWLINLCITFWTVGHPTLRWRGLFYALSRIRLVVMSWGTIFRCTWQYVSRWIETIIKSTTIAGI